VNSFVNALQRFGLGRLAVLMGVGGGAAALLLAIVLNLGLEPMGLLYSNLDLREAGSITQSLDQAGIKYEVKGDGSTIMVARDKVASTRLMLAGKGLPTSSSVGYEIFDTQNALGQTDLIQQLNMKRATEGELARTIRSLDGVTFARVHLVLPERQLFQDGTDKSSASVTIGIGAREPSMDQVRAVQNLVSGAVPNLKPEDVVVIDQHGKTLSAAGDTSIEGKAAQDEKASIEDSMRDRIKNLVEGVVGVGKARVQVSADVDMSQVTTQEEKYDPDGQVVRSEQTNEQDSKENQGSGGPATAASASSNVPGGPATASNAAESGNQSNGTESTTNYEISKTTTTQIQQPGTIKRLSVAVAVDGLTPVGKDGKPGAYTPRTAEEMQHLNDLVKAAMGFSTDRGDSVQVVNVRFPDAEDGEGVSASSPLLGFDKNDIMRAVELAILGLVSILTLFFVVRPLIRGATAGGGGMGLPMLTGGGGGGGQTVTRVVTMTDGGGGGVDASTGQPLALPGPDIDTKIDIARIEGQVKASSIKRVSEFVDKHPEESVSILRGWLHESA
jgi:flagellar M-ring protein FliF